MYEIYSYRYLYLVITSRCSSTELIDFRNTPIAKKYLEVKTITKSEVIQGGKLTEAFH